MLLVVGDRDRHAEGFLVGRVLEGIHDVTENPVARRAKFAGARPTALDVPLEVGFLRQQIGQVGAQRPLVHVGIFEFAADEHDPVTFGQWRHRPERQVVTAQDVVGWESVGGQRGTQDDRVKVRAVVGQEDQRRGFAQRSNVLQLRVVDVSAVGPRHPLAQLVPHHLRGAARAGYGGDFLQVPGDLALHTRAGPTGLCGDVVDEVLERGGLDHLRRGLGRSHTRIL